MTIDATGTTGSPLPTASAPVNLIVYPNTTRAVPVSSVDSALKNGEADPSFSMVASPDQKYPGLAARTLILPNWITNPGLWYTSGGNSYWIGPRAMMADGNSPGVYKYQTRFYLNELDLPGASVTSNWASDNDGVIRVNGAQVHACNRLSENPAGSYSFQTAATCQIASSFLRDGENVIEYEITNGWTSGNPTGVSVQNTGGQASTKSFADYTLVPTTMVPTQVTAGAGSQTFSFTTTPINGFSWPASVDNPINFTTEPIIVSSQGPAVELTSSVTPTATGANLTVNYTAATPVGTYTIPIKAVGGGRTKYASVLLRIGPEAPSVLGLSPQPANSASQVFTVKAQQGSLSVYRVLLLFNTAVSGTDDCQILLQTTGSNVWTAKLSPPNWNAQRGGLVGSGDVGASWRGEPQ